MEALAGWGVLGVTLFVVILGLLTILLPLSAYSAQKWANKTYKEAVKTNQKLDELISHLTSMDSK